MTAEQKEALRGFLTSTIGAHTRSGIYDPAHMDYDGIIEQVMSVTVRVDFVNYKNEIHVQGIHLVKLQADQEINELNREVQRFVHSFKDEYIDSQTIA